MASDHSPELLEFPCEFPLKVMGRAVDEFEMTVHEIVSRHIEGLDASDFASRLSSGGKYVSVTVVFEARSRAQLDALYLELTAHEKILMVL